MRRQLASRAVTAYAEVARKRGYFLVGDKQAAEQERGEVTGDNLATEVAAIVARNKAAIRYILIDLLRGLLA